MAANYNANLINPYTGQPFGPPPAGVLVRSTSSYYRNSAPLDTFAPALRLRLAAAGRGRTARGARRLRTVLPDRRVQRQRRGTPLFTSPPFAQGFTNADSSNNLSSLQKPFPTTTLGYVLRTPTSQLSDRVAGPDYVVPRLHQWNLSTQFRLLRGLTFDIGYVGSQGSRLLLARGLNQPLLASAGSPSELRLRRRGRRLHHHQHRAERRSARPHHGGDADGTGRQ